LGIIPFCFKNYKKFLTLNYRRNYLISMKFDQLELDRPSEMVRLPDELLTASAALAAQPDLFCDLLDNFQSFF